MKRLIRILIFVIVLTSQLWLGLPYVSADDSLTFSPDANVETSSVDGIVYDTSNDLAWANIIIEAGSGAGPSTAATQLVGMKSSTTSSQWASLYRGIFLFNTVSLPDDALLTGVTFSIYGTGKLDELGITPNICIYSSSPASNTNLVAGDFDSLGSTVLSTNISYVDWNTAGYNTFTLNADGLAAISKTGVSMLGARNANYDVAGIAPNWVSNKSSYLNCAYADQGEAYKPLLVVEYIIPPDAPTNVAATDGEHTDKVVVTWTKSAGATGYRVYEGANLLDTLGDVASYDDTAAEAGTITPGATDAADNISSSYVTLTVAGHSTDDGASRTYKVVAFNNAGDSPDSDTDIGYRGVGMITYQWQRSAADSDADYSNIDGATTNPYNDTGGVVDPDGRYYQALLDAEGAAQQTTTVDRGNMSVVIGVPTDFTLTDLGAITIQMDWTKGTNSTYTMIRASREDYPTAITEGELVYYGDNVTDNTSGYALDVNSFFFTAWGFASDNITYSDNYTTATIGGDGVTEIATAITELGTIFGTGIDIGLDDIVLSGVVPLILSDIIPLMMLLGLAGLAYWRGDKPLFAMAGFAFILYGFPYWDTSNSFSIIMVLSGCFMIFRAFSKKGVKI